MKNADYYNKWMDKNALKLLFNCVLLKPRTTEAHTYRGKEPLPRGVDRVTKWEVCPCSQPTIAGDFPVSFLK